MAVANYYVRPNGGSLGQVGMGGGSYWSVDPDVQAQIAGRSRDIDAQIAGQRYGIDAGQARFNSVFPWLQGQMSSLMGGMATAGGQSGPSPEITVGGVWDPQQVQQQVNSARAHNDQATQTQSRLAASQAAGRGFGSRSPLTMALQGQLQNQNMAQNATAGREIRWNAAKGNADQRLKSQTAREAQFSNRMTEDIERKKPVFGTMNAMLSALGGMI
jgi:hypothetical protein